MIFFILNIISLQNRIVNIQVSGHGWFFVKLYNKKILGNLFGPINYLFCKPLITINIHFKRKWGS
ncbi:MAG: hypothetical protein EBU05_03390 [Chitinophagia bacterium]|nr:hypothetical protein [Chitinophagia bacterium]